MAVFEAISKAPGRLRFFLLKGVRLPVCLGLLGTALIWWLHSAAPPAVSALLSRLDNVIYDQRFNLLIPSLPEGRHKIVIVDYDQRSLEAEGQWPWSRFKLGDMVRELADAGVLVIGFDVFFPEPERNLLTELETRLDPAQRAALPALAELQELLDGDGYFAEQMQLTDVVLGFSFRAGETVRTGILPEPIISLDEHTAVPGILRVQGYEGNIATLQDATLGAGFFDTVPDIDGIIRRSPLVLQYGDAIYPSLALEMARLYLFEDNFSLETETDSFGSRPQLTGIGMGQIRIPTDTAGNVLVPYKGPSRLGTAGTFPYISATDVLRGNLSAAEREALQNSLVLVGTTATGLFDLRATPLEAVFPGVEVHANILNGLLNAVPSTTVAADSTSGNPLMAALGAAQLNPFPSRPDWEQGAIAFSILLIGILLSLIYPRLGPALLALSSLTFMLGLIALNFKLWVDYKLDLSLIILLLLILLITVINMTYGFLREGLSRRLIKGMFDQYVPPAHIDKMLQSPDSYNFEGESKELSVLFSDIRNFTSISESLSAVELKALLNDFFTPITGIIFEEQGTIDKYVGDMVMAFWGAPIDDPQHRLHAVRAALRMLDKVEELKPHFAARGLPEVNIGIGINSGFMNVGDMGSTYRRSYTVLGDAVNLASRLEGITKFYGVKLLIGEDTHDHCEGLLCRLVDRVQVKGKEQAIRIYQPLCMAAEASEAQRTLLSAYEEAYAAYLRQDWQAAAARFEALCGQDPAHQVLYTVYLERIGQLKSAAALPADWDGTFRHTEK